MKQPMSERPQEEMIQWAIDLAVEHHSAGRLTQAESMYKQILQADPNQPIAIQLLGVIAHQLGKNDIAVDLIRKALAIEPTYAEAHNNLGLALQTLGRQADALASYRRALDVNPRYPEAHNNVGTILRELGQFQEASDSFRAALSINPDSADLYNNLGLTLQELGRLSEATDQYTKALAIHPDHPEANYNFGNTLRQLQRLDEAIECLVRSESSTSNQKTSAVLLECYYIKQDPIGFSRQLKKISKMQGFNFRAASISAFVSHQLGTNNLYEFCKHPIDLVTIYDLLDSGEISSDLITQIETMIKNNSNNEVLAPGHISLGFKSTGNLFDEPSPIVNIFEQIIRRCIRKFVHQHDNSSKDRIFRNWPKNYALNGWYIRLLSGGEVTAHVHDGWISGVFYLRVPTAKENNAGNIKLSLNGYNLPVINNDFPTLVIETKPGLLVLFPSSVPHQVIPFFGNDERISISFDMIPK